MTPKEVAALDGRLDRFLADLTASLGRSERHHWAKVYMQGLLMEGGRKSIEPLAGRIAGRMFNPCASLSVKVLGGRTYPAKTAEKVVDLLAEPEVWMIDETSFPKAGNASVGVARQYCGALGKIANCQVAVSLHWSTCEVSCPLAWRLYLPQSWLETPARRAEGKIPDDIQLPKQEPIGVGIGGSSVDVGRAPSASGRRFRLRQRL